MPVERRGPAVGDVSANMGGKGEMIKAPDHLQDLRRKLYVKAKAEPRWRFWGLYVHVCKMETLQEAYRMAKSNDGAPGNDGVTFRAIEESGVESFLKQIQDELVHDTYRPMPVRKREIPKDGGTKVRVLSIPDIRDRVVQGALKLILEPIFEADFQSGSYGYRPKRTAQEAVLQVDRAIMEEKTRIIDLDLRAYFDSGSALSAAGEGGPTGARCKGDETTQPDPEVDREERGSARRSDFTFAEQCLSQ